MESLGLKVARLIRISYGPFQLGHLAEGQVEEIPTRLWREQLGIGRKKHTGDPHDAPWKATEKSKKTRKTAHLAKAKRS
jgi:23S rRNA pseudouridine2605 synthase